jgi:hypothetical protein
LAFLIKQRFTTQHHLSATDDVYICLFCEILLHKYHIDGKHVRVYHSLFVNKQAFWRWRIPNMGIEGVELSKTDKRQKSYITIDVFKIMIYSQSG